MSKGVITQDKAHKAENYAVASVDRLPGERWVSMTNALVRAGHGLTLSEKRLVACAASKLDSKKKLLPGNIPVTKITAAEYAEVFEVDSDTAYNQLKSAADKLFNREITFYQRVSRLRDNQVNRRKIKMRWVGKAIYNPGEGMVELHWWPDVLPHLTGLSKKFTTYQLQQTSALRSAYSWRLLEMLTQFESSGWAEYDIDDFTTAMDATDKQKQDFAAIRRKIIEPSVKELSEKDGWLIQWKPIRSGRKVIALRFQFERDPQGRLEL